MQTRQRRAEVVRELDQVWWESGDHEFKLPLMPLQLSPQLAAIFLLPGCGGNGQSRVSWFSDKDTTSFCDFLSQWPTFKAVHQARRATLERFFRQHHVQTRVIAPRLLVAFGAQRDRYASASELQQYAGIAPVTERSGNTCWVHWRLQCPKFLRQTFVEWAGESIRHSFWARAYYAQQRAKGSTHQAATRALAFKWIRILYRCWQTNTPYDESTYLNALARRGSPLIRYLASIS